MNTTVYGVWSEMYDYSFLHGLFTTEEEAERFAAKKSGEYRVQSETLYGKTTKALSRRELAKIRERAEEWLEIAIPAGLHETTQLGRDVLALLAVVEAAELTRGQT